ncbi:MAG: GNAT family N-acetyltransferase [Pseudonocardia sp. SCN 72-86]|nr:MAG: GNAT family N-acetyltransferase [Pseudonocardia sp. SCN 72-86]
MAIAAIRPATPDDVDEIVRIQAVTWRAAYAGLVPDEALAQLEGPDARQAWTDAVAAANAAPGTGPAGSAFHVFVAKEGDWTVGFCAAAGHRGEGGVLAEVNTLLVEPRWGRRGHGGRLLAHAAKALRESGSDFGHAWVAERDEATLRFYRTARWEPDGAARTLDTGDGALREIRVVGSLDLALSE